MTNALICALALLQQPEGDIRTLIENLGSEKIEVREAATEKLKKLGDAAKPALEEAAKSRDPERAARAQSLLRFFEVRGKITPGLLKSIPDAADRLATSDKAWAEVLLEATRFKETELLHPHLGRKDLEFLAVPALEGAVGSKQRLEVLHRINQWHFKSARTAVVNLMRDEDASVRLSAMRSFLATGPETTPAFVEALKDDDVKIRAYALSVLAERRDPGVLPYSREALEKGPAELKTIALSTLFYLEGKAAAKPEILKHLDALKPETAARILGILGDPEQAPRLFKMIRDKDEYVRGAAVNALCRLNARQYLDEFVKMLDEEVGDMRYVGGSAVAKMGSAEHGAKFLFMLKEEDRKMRLTGVVRLRELDAPVHAKHLIPMIRDPDPGVRVHAAEGLLALGTADVDAVLPLLDPKGASYISKPGDPARIVADMAMRSGKEVQDRIATYFKKMEEDPSPDLSTIAAVALVRMGRKDRAAQLALVERVQSSPLYRVYAGFLCDSLALAYEPRLGIRIEVKRVIETAEEVNAALKPSGLRVEFEWPIVEGRTRAGRTLTAFEIIRRHTPNFIVPEGDVLRLHFRPGDPWTSLDFWNERLNR